jgi:dTDP-4-amino-4,6-dideoxygalactose transaminase
MSEINAAFGLLQLRYIDEALKSRRHIECYYWKVLANVKGISILEKHVDAAGNDSYFPIFVGYDYPLSRDSLYKKMRDLGIYCRSYIYPLISDMPMCNGLPSASKENLPVAKNKSDQVLCLPIYPDMTLRQIDEIIKVIRHQKL